MGIQSVKESSNNLAGFTVPTATWMDLGTSMSIVWFGRWSGTYDSTASVLMGSLTRFYIAGTNSPVSFFVEGTNCPSTSSLTTTDAFIVGTYDGTNMRIYFNSVLENTVGNTTSITGTSSLGLLWNGNGATTGANAASAFCHFAMLYDRPLTQEEITAMYVSKMRVFSHNGVVCHYDMMEQPSGTSISHGVSQIYDRFGGRHMTGYINSGSPAFTFESSPIEFQGGQ